MAQSQEFTRPQLDPHMVEMSHRLFNVSGHEWCSELNEVNRRRWLAAVEYLGARWLLLNPVQRKDAA